MRAAYRFMVIFLLLATSTIYGIDHELLQMSDVNKIMKQIFEQHVDKKEMTLSILKNSFRVYIDQFDPDRLYLLESEVHPFLNMNDTQLSLIMEQYQKQQFSEYLELNTLFQKAIVRAQKVRAGWGNEDFTKFFEQSGSVRADGYEDWSDPDLHHPFAANENELNHREQQGLVRFMAAERQRYGDNVVKSRLLQVVKLFEREARTHENQYLFLTDAGNPMSEVEKQNAFAMHILKALANSLDAHTTILSSAEASEMRLRLEKEVHGIGISIKSADEGKVILSGIVDGGPAAKNGQLQIGDQIVQIDHVTVQGKSADEVLNLIRGPSGSSIELVIKRKGEENEKSIKLTRGEIAVDQDRVLSTYEKFDGGIIGKIKLDSFYQNESEITSENDVRNAINKLKKQGNLKGLIIDLRENSGGFLMQSVKVVGLFITNGVVVISKYFNGEEHFYRDMDSKMAYDGPLIILTSKATASAAEIMAQALQDYGVAVIVGDERTYGKGSIQSQTVTDNEGPAFLKVTVGKYYTVSGKTPQIQGVKADVVVPTQFVHENIGERYLENPLTQDKIVDAYSDDLSDVVPNLKEWYMHYYTPHLQHKKLFWEKIIPELRERSGNRISHNPYYQSFLKNTTAGSTPQMPTDLTLEEAVNVMKDMITIQSQQRHEG